MIAKLRGVLDGVGDGWAVVDVGGVGYLTYCSAGTLASMPARGQEVSLTVETVVREDHIHLYGFASEQERRLVPPPADRAERRRSPGARDSGAPCLRRSSRPASRPRTERGSRVRPGGAQARGAHPE